jgi:hypothetical protein
MHKSEREFANFLESQGKTYVYHPKRFKFNGTSYQADFYCPEDNTYYEVKTCLSSAETFKLLTFKKYHPNLKFKIVSANGYSFYSQMSGEYLATLEKKLNILKTRDILEISLEEYYENIKGLYFYKPSSFYGNGRRVFPLTEERIKFVDEVKKKLGMKQRRING